MLVLTYGAAVISLSILVCLVIHSHLSSKLTLALQITGIWAMKAYKCLENPRPLLFVFGALQVCAFVFVGFDLRKMEASRRLSSAIMSFLSTPLRLTFSVTQAAVSRPMIRSIPGTTPRFSAYRPSWCSFAVSRLLLSHGWIVGITCCV